MPSKDVLDAVLQWTAGGMSLIPISPNGTKRPAVQWKQYQAEAANLDQVQDWFGNGRELGIAVITGKVSGNLELIEVEARACGPESWIELHNRIDEAGLTDLWGHLIGPEGYSEESPTGGFHVLYRISDHPVPGNEKVASRPATPEELEVKPRDKVKVLAETRGEGGYVIVAPSTGLCHPTGKPWSKVSGEYGVVPSITWEQRCLLHSAIRQALNYDLPATAATVAVRPAPLPAPASPMHAVERGGAELRPGDDFEQRISWAQLLVPQGWTKGMVESDGTTYWTRPGKEPRDGYSATTGHSGDRDRLWVFSTSTLFPAEESITKFRAYSLLHHNGDDSSAARSLANQNFGSRPAVAPDYEFGEHIEGSKDFELTDQGNAVRTWDRVKGTVLWSVEEKAFICFNGKFWANDESCAYRMAAATAKELMDSSDKTIAKWGKRSRSDAAVMASLRALKHLPGVSVSARAFNVQRDLLNLQNCTLDLRTGERMDHTPDHMITQMFNASLRPEATCEEFDKFIETVLPDPTIRAYVQRALGATLLGSAGSRAIFLAHGPSGTGKTQLQELFQHLFGTYGTTAPASTFRQKRDSAPPHDLHRLRGKRFVATSETSDAAAFDEELIKRLTGGDTITSRDLYEGFQEWVPECNIWVATNFAPQFNSDDNAMWKRAKLIPFTTVIGETEGSPKPIPDFARTVLFAEADGILNWLLAGLQDYLTNGLQEPAQVGEAAAQLRLESDPVAQFVEESHSEGNLVMGPEHRVRSATLHLLYVEWCKRNGQRVWVGQRRFVNRLQTAYPQLSRLKSNGVMWWEGVGQATGASVLGSFGLKDPD